MDGARRPSFLRKLNRFLSPTQAITLVTSSACWQIDLDVKILIIGKVVCRIRINTFLGDQDTPGKAPYVSIVTRFLLQLSLRRRQRLPLIGKE